MLKNISEHSMPGYFTRCSQKRVSTSRSRPRGANRVNWTSMNDHTQMVIWMPRPRKHKKIQTHSIPSATSAARKGIRKKPLGDLNRASTSARTGASIPVAQASGAPKRDRRSPSIPSIAGPSGFVVNVAEPLARSSARDQDVSVQFCGSPSFCIDVCICLPVSCQF